MARLTTPLTDKEIKEAKPKEKEYKLFDGGGLYLSITPKAQKWWRLKYRFDGKEKRLSLGVYPATTLLDAREEREKLKKLIRDGIDPSQERSQAKEDKKKKEIEDAKKKYTFENLTNDYFISISTIQKPLSEKYREKQQRRVIKHCFPTLKLKPACAVTEEDILAILETLKAKEYYEVARRVLMLIKAILRFGVRRKKLEHNVAIDISPKEDIGKRSKNHYSIITDPKELGELLIALDSYSGDYSVRQALRVMPYLAFRPYNIRFLEWYEVDLDKKLITIPKEKMKMKLEFIVPISDFVVMVLKEMKLFCGDGKYVFPSNVNKDRPLSENTLNVALRRLGYTRKQLVSHSFRGIFSSIAHDNMLDHKCSSLAIEFQLSHKDPNEIREAYNSAILLDERRVLVDWWSDFLDGVRA